jgi:hypothetical protein
MRKDLDEKRALRSTAITMAIATLRREPSIVELASRRPKPYRIEKFEKQIPIRDYLRHCCKSRDYASGQAAGDLFEYAVWWIDEGEGIAVADLYKSRLESGRISQLKPRDIDLHRAIFMVAYSSGNAKVIASLRYLAIILRLEFQDKVYPPGIMDSLKRLETKQLIEFEYSGKRSPGHTKSNIISIAFDLEFVEDDAPEYIIELLTFHPQTVEALADYTSKKVANVSSSIAKASAHMV